MDYKHIIESAYNRQNWLVLLRDIFGNRIQMWATPLDVETKSDTAQSALYLAKITLADGNEIAVYEVKLSENVVIERNKVNIRNLLVSHWRSNGFAGAFMFCYKHNESVLRFSYVSEIMEFQEDGKLGTTATDTKRFTYYLGEGHRSRTAIDQFAKLKGSGQTLDDITKAFSIEAVSDAFFAGYKNIYEDIVEYMTGKRMTKVGNKWEEVTVGKGDPAIVKEFSVFKNPLKSMRDYAKKLLGRLVFLQFLQKKGWLGVKKDAEWGTGDREFMSNLFSNSKQKDDFIEKVLEPLFNDINTQRDGDLVSDKNVGTDIKVPFLNGGLFERDMEDETTIKLPAKYFEQLFDFFSQYNFTIDENDPNDTEVGVDPEMLGRIFENLLEDNKDKGAFYTPKEIVRYMCAESLIAYLQTDIADDTEKDNIRNFISTHEVKCLSEKLIPIVKQKLKDVKICDPAIGSGAFPIGLLNELFACCEALEGEQVNRAEIKRHIIQNSIYGVDIEKGAVDIARLRFWLSLVVDEDKPDALPNLDFKIMQGNSLLEQYCGVDLSNILQSDDMFVRAAAADLSEKLKQYYLTNSHDNKMELRAEITEIVENCIREANSSAPSIKVDGNDQFFLWHTWFHDVFNRPNGCNGFDIVIGNPPYVNVKHSIDALQKNQYISCYKAAKGQFDLFTLFIELSLSIGKSVSFIVPKPVLNNENYSISRFQLLNNNLAIIVTGSGIFENAGVESCIFLTLPNNSTEQVSISEYVNGSVIHKNIVDRSYYKNTNNYIISTEINDADIHLMSKLNDFPVIEGIIDIKRGVEAGKKDDSIVEYRTKYKLLRGQDFGRYYIDFQDKYCEFDLFDSTKFKSINLYKDPKILIRRVSNSIQATYDDDQYIVLNTIYCAKLKNGIRGDIKYYTALLNSKVIAFWFFKTFCNTDKLFPYIRVSQIERLPIPSATAIQQQQIITLVDKILATKKSNPQADTSALEHEIDQLVYQLYGLTDEEIAIVEND